MSHNGQMHRGLKWWNTRDRDSVLSKDIKDNADKMSDVNYFLNKKIDLDEWCPCFKCKVSKDVEVSKRKEEAETKSSKGKKEVK